MLDYKLVMHFDLHLGQKTTVVIKWPILASLPAAPVTYGGSIRATRSSRGFDCLCFAAGEYACLSYKSFWEVGRKWLVYSLFSWLDGERGEGRGWKPAKGNQIRAHQRPHDGTKGFCPFISICSLYVEPRKGEYALTDEFCSGFPFCFLVRG